jgi:hypothetical protein
LVALKASEPSTSHCKDFLRYMRSALTSHEKLKPQTFQLGRIDMGQTIWKTGGSDYAMRNCLRKVLSNSPAVANRRRRLTMRAALPAV